MFLVLYTMAGGLFMQRVPWTVLLDASCKRSGATTAANKKRKGKKAEASKRLDFSESRPQKAGLSCSVVSLHLAFDVSLEAALAHHTLFLSPQIKSSWDNTKQGNTFKAADGVNFYVHAPSRTDATACPIGDFDAITVLVPIPPLATQNSFDAQPTP